MEFRFAEINDAGGIVAIVNNFVRETADDYEIALVSSRYLEAQLVKLISVPAGCVIIAEEMGEIVGVLVGAISGSLFSPAIVAEELMWWIEPEFRGKGLPMMRMFEKWAKDSGAVMCIMSGFDDLDRLYTIRGYKKRSTHYAKEVK